MKKVMNFVACVVSSFAVTGISVTSACDRAGEQAVTATVSPVTVTISRVLVELDALTVPVADKVQACRSELAQEQQHFKRLESAEAHFASAAERSMKTMVAMKSLFGQSGCLIQVGCESYTRETVANSLRQKIAEYKVSKSAASELAVFVESQRKKVETIAAKVARWEQAEKALVAEVDQLQTQQAVTRQERHVPSTTIGESIQLMKAVDTMIRSAKPSVGVSLSDRERELLVEVDELLEDEKSEGAE
jgi:hypothetical protein